MIKTFKIGECCKGGIIQVKITKTRLTVSQLDYYTKKVNESIQYNLTYINAYRGIDKILDDITWSLENWTTPYYAGKVVEFIEKELQNK